MPSGSDNTERLVRYLIGQMPEGERQQLEEEYFSDETLHEELLAVETELLDAHARGDLSPEEQRHFLGRSSEQNVRQRIMFSQALGRRAGLPPQRMPAPTRTRRSILDALHARWWVALPAVATVALLIIGVTQMVRRGAPDKATAQVTTKYRASELPPLRTATPTVSLILFPGQRSASQENRFPLPRVESIVRMEIVLEETGQYSAFDVALKAVDWPFSESFNALSIQQGAKGERELVVQCPSGRLRPGDYTVSVYGVQKGSREEIAGYSFRVDKP